MYRETRWGWPILVGFLTAFPASAGDGTEPAFSHADWSAVLQRAVDDQGLVDYGSLAENREDLDRYLSALAGVSPETHPELFPTRAEALAYYLNAYNAFVFEGVLKRWPNLDSVWGNPIASFNFFVSQKFISGGEKIHLKGLEDNTVRAQFQDPRVHAVLNCASYSCPRLHPRAVEPATLEEQLDEAMGELVSAPKHFRLDDERREVWVSKVFDWFESDFLAYEKSQGNPKPSVIDYVNRYRDAEARVPKSYRVKFLKFDKTLNKQ